MTFRLTNNKAGFEPGPPVLQAYAMTTAPRRRGIDLSLFKHSIASICTKNEFNVVRLCTTPSNTERITRNTDRITRNTGRITRNTDRSYLCWKVPHDTKSIFRVNRPQSSLNQVRWTTGPFSEALG
jgi:hypothetical protein